MVTLLENMAAGGNVLGSTFEDLRDMIEGVESKHRVGVCLDTAHSFAAGYDLRSPEAFKKTLEEFDSTVGLKYLRALHLNDSKAPFDARRDLHANIGTGFLGLRAFHNIMNEPRLRRLPMVLETPIDRKDENGREQQDKGIWAAEIKLLESMVGMDPDGKEFKRLEAELWERGKAERDRVQEQVDRRDEKKAKKEAKDKDKGKGKGMGRGQRERRRTLKRAKEAQVVAGVAVSVASAVVEVTEKLLDRDRYSETAIASSRIRRLFSSTVVPFISRKTICQLRSRPEGHEAHVWRARTSFVGRLRPFATIDDSQTSVR